MTLLAAPLPSEFFPWWLMFVIGLWLAVSFIISLMGWWWFARKYRARVRPAGRAYNVPSAYLGGLGGYRNVVRVIFTEEGIYFYVFFLFRPFHAPFLLPWDKVTGLAEKKGLFLGRYYQLVVEEGAGLIDLRLPEKAGQDLFKYLRRPQEVAS